MGKYASMYRLGIRPWERYAEVAREQIEAAFDRELEGRPSPPGRALDLGCGRGMHTPSLARRGWEAVGVDDVASAIADAKAADHAGAEYVVADITRLPTELGTFDHFVDIGCFQGLSASQRRAVGRGVTERARPGATLLMLAFGRSWFRWLAEGVSRDEVAAAFERWQIVEVAPAPAEGLGWPMSRTRPRWYRLRFAG